MFKLVSGNEAVSKIKSGDHVCVIGNLNLLETETILHELEQSFLKSGSPQNLTVMFPVFIGTVEGRGVDHFSPPGMLKRVIGGSFCSMLPNRKLNEMINNNQVEAYNIPMGSFYNLLKNTGAGQPGLFTGVGLKTQADPRYNGGRLNDFTSEDIVEIKELDGKEWLYYRRLKVDVAVIRGTSVDEIGNISLENEPTSQGILATAMAAKNNGGIVIAQVRRKIQRGSVHPRLVMVPGQLVDYVVLDERDEDEVQKHPQSVLGNIREPIEKKGESPLDQRKIILRRAAMELRKNDLVNLGFGVPAEFPSVAVEENILDDIQFTIEHGPIGGVPGWSGVFGVAVNPDLILDSTDVFDLYAGGMLNLTFLGMGEVDQYGNVNNHKFKHIVAGTGGFNDIIHQTPVILLGGTFTAGGLKTEVADGKLIIHQEGKHKKFNPSIEGITLNADEARRKKQRVLYITERAVFELGERAIRLIEIAPGIDLQRHILDNLDFRIEIAEDLKVMDSRIFEPGNMGIRITENGCEFV
jgi:propionate CoA-transferase